MAILSLALALSIGVAGTVAAHARLSYINMTTTVLSVSSGQATCVGSVSGYKGTTTKVVITLHLERKLASSSTWTTFASDPAKTFNDWTGTYQMKKTVTSGYQYRVRAVYTAFAGSASETLTGYSSVVSF